jgi:hypothetical protein
LRIRFCSLLSQHCFGGLFAASHEPEAEQDAGPNCEQTSQFSDMCLQIHDFGFACSQSVSFAFGERVCLLPGEFLEQSFFTADFTDCADDEDGAFQIELFIRVIRAIRG